jgi:hypothetical protein
MDYKNKHMGRYPGDLFLMDSFYNIKELQFSIAVSEKKLIKYYVGIGNIILELESNKDDDGNIITKIIVNGKEFHGNSEKLKWVKRDGLIPYIHQVSSRESNKGLESIKFSNSRHFNTLFVLDHVYGNGVSDIYLGKILGILRKKQCYTEKRMKANEIKILQYLLEFNVLFADAYVLKEGLLKRDKISKSQRDKVGRQLEDKDWHTIFDLLIFMHVNSIIYLCNNILSFDMKNVKYVKPIRSDVQRYYRIQGLNVKEIDSSGENIPMFLHSLSNSENEDFKKWTKKYFNIILSIEESAGHVSLNIQSGSVGHERTLNLADVGYGYSQVLPILVWLWTCKQGVSNKKANDNKTITLVIEQPEVHLHPAFQAKIIDLFVDIINNSMVINNGEERYRIKILFETHSEAMINRLGYLIAKKKLNSDLINVVIFDKNIDSVNNGTKVCSTKFSDEGELTNWPIGFFSPERLKDDNTTR